MEEKTFIEQAERFREDVRDYYGKRLRGSSDLKTGACSCSASPCEEAAGVIPLIDGEILDRFYGCGSPIPPLLEGMTVLDLGCGTGRDAFIASKLVGPDGRVIGIDMTREQLDVAEAHVASQTERFGYSSPNVEFRQGYIEDLRSAGIEDGSIDVVISNCVVNLCPRKDLVFSEIGRVLKDGGELYFSDVFADRRVPDKVYADPVLRGECLAGAMYVEDFRRAMAKAGFPDVRYTSVSDISIDDPDMRRLLGDVRFTSRTVRAFKLEDLEDGCEDYGQAVIYDGRIPGHPDWFDLDENHRFYTNSPVPVCGNTASMCSGTRYGKHLHARGDRSRHRGRFEPRDDDRRGGCCCRRGRSAGRRDRPHQICVVVLPAVMDAMDDRRDAHAVLLVEADRAEVVGVGMGGNDVASELPPVTEGELHQQAAQALPLGLPRDVELVEVEDPVLLLLQRDQAEVPPAFGMHKVPDPRRMLALQRLHGVPPVEYSPRGLRPVGDLVAVGLNEQRLNEPRHPLQLVLAQRHRLHDAAMSAQG